ncbi:MAG: polymer-forming cytoskeletal protein [Gammaproteobacteria bacterium]|nr:polymer-forming cytoskeletal protein [Gammaproteobacteria bacterium]MDH5593177.1 polymer-forming cytoskeletal protein [Gammaproteobacteria bacterium]MDH5614116.1 polymer-forming cytoskeletal protein [Gammaproteobacteria bacterium]
MFGKGKKLRKVTKIDTLVGQNTELKGDVTFKGGIHVDGVIKGNVISENDSGSSLTLSENGRIEGDVRVPNVVLNGTVIGDVHAIEGIELAANARVKGNVYYNLIEMAMGAEVNGSLVHRSEPMPMQVKQKPVEEKKATSEQQPSQSTSAPKVGTLAGAPSVQ